MSDSRRTPVGEGAVLEGREKPKERIMIVNKQDFLGDSDFHGFLPVEKSEVDYLDLIGKAGRFEERTPELERNPEYKQPIVYIYIVNKDTGKFFVYTRAGEKYQEERLRRKASLAVGGHIDEKDLQNGPLVFAAARREISEEIEITDGEYDLRLVGFINEDQSPAGQHHFGLVFKMEVSSGVKSKGDSVNEEGFVSLVELKAKVEADEIDLEPWSKILLDGLEKAN